MDKCLYSVSDTDEFETDMIIVRTCIWEPLFEDDSIQA